MLVETWQSTFRGLLANDYLDSMSEPLQIERYRKRLKKPQVCCIRSIAGRETEVRSTNMREPGDPERVAIGKQLLIGTNWNGELVLGDRESMVIFGNWRERWERDLERRGSGRSTSTPSRGPEH